MTSCCQGNQFTHKRKQLWWYHSDYSSDLRKKKRLQFQRFVFNSLHHCRNKDHCSLCLLESSFQSGERKMPHLPSARSNTLLGIYINTPTIYLPVSKNHRKNHTEDSQGRRKNFFNWQDCDKYPLTLTPPIEQQLASQVLKHPTSNRPYLKHSIVCIQFCFPGRHEKTAFFFLCQSPRSLKNWVFHACSKWSLPYAHSSYLENPKESELSWLTTTTIIQLCSPCKSHRGFIP